MKIQGKFIECRQGINETHNDHRDSMRSLLRFVIMHDGKQYGGSAIVNQTGGGTFKDDSLEVGNVEYPKDAPQFRDDQFRTAAEAYYRRLVGSTGLGVRSGGGATVTMAGNTFAFEMPFEIESADPDRGA